MKKVTKIAMFGFLTIVFIAVISSISIAQPQLKEPLKPPVDSEKLKPQILKGPDLVVTSLRLTGPPNVVGDKVELPIRVVVKNQGNASAGRFKVAIEYTTPDGRTSPAPFTVGGDVWYPYIDSLDAGAERTLTGKVTFLVRNVSLTIVAIADSCSGDEFMPAHCRVNEINENNNMSFRSSVRLP